MAQYFSSYCKFVSTPVSLLGSLIVPFFYHRLWLACFFWHLLLDRASGLCSKKNSSFSNQTFPPNNAINIFHTFYLHYKVLSAQLLRSIQIFLAVLAQINSINKKTQQWLSLPHPSPYFWPLPPPWYKFLSLPSLLLPLKSKLVVITVFQKILTTHLPKLCLLCRLQKS